MSENTHPPVVRVACVAEDIPAHRSKTLHLLRSLRACGGSLSNASFLACFVEKVDPRTREALADLGAEVVVVDRVDPRYPHANKIRMLQVPGDHDLLLALDIDIVFAGDVSSYLAMDAVSAKVVDRCTLEPAAWDELFTAAGLVCPPFALRSTFSQTPIPPYFNSGVLMIPATWQDSLARAWLHWTAWVLDNIETMPLVAPSRFFTDQIALALALVDLDMPWRALPLALNLPTNLCAADSLSSSLIPPLLLHYHGDHDAAGLLLTTGVPVVDAAIAGVNRSLARDVSSRPSEDTSFDNAAFWDRRYRVDPNLGSGLGSRGVFVEYKQHLLSMLVREWSVESVLDVGCGDIVVTKDVPLPQYTGVDISAEVIRRNKETCPERRFLAGNFIELSRDMDLTSDLVVCFDVLIHQHGAQEYTDMVRALVRATRRVGVVAAYESRPEGNHASHITAWHAPISRSLEEAGARRVSILGGYRGTAVVRWEAPLRA